MVYHACSSPNEFFLLTEVASQLGYDELDDITREDMTLEVIIYVQAICSFFLCPNQGIPTRVRVLIPWSWVGPIRAAKLCHTRFKTAVFPGPGFELGTTG